MEQKKPLLIRRTLPRNLKTRRKARKKHRYLPLLLAALLLLLSGYSLLGRGYQLPFHLPWETPRSTTVQILPEKFSRKANQFLEADQKNANLPLLLQTDERWGDAAYGSEASQNDLAHNGCALASLAMIDSYWEKNSISPTDVLNWAQNNYYVTGQGTSWQIFSDFAVAHDLQFENLGNHFNRAKEFMNNGIPVIVSVKPGTFTTVGHIMVLATDSKGRIKVYDPNDNPTKEHYRKTYDSETFVTEGINYWALWKR